MPDNGPLLEGEQEWLRLARLELTDPELSALVRLAPVSSLMDSGPPADLVRKLKSAIPRLEGPRRLEAVAALEDCLLGIQSGN
jgi:hypothetical protein